MSVAETNGVILDTFERSSASQTKGNHRKLDGVEHPDKALYITVSAEDDTILDITRLGRPRTAVPSGERRVNEQEVFVPMVSWWRESL